MSKQEDIFAGDFGLTDETPPEVKTADTLVTRLEDSVTFWVKLAWKLLTLSRRLFKSLAASAQTLLATKLESNAQVMAIFFIIVPQIMSLPIGSSLYSLFQANHQLEQIL